MAAPPESALDTSTRWMMELALPSRVDPPAACRQAVYHGPLRERLTYPQNRNNSDWLLCDDLQPPCLVFSIGIGNQWQFGELTDVDSNSRAPCSQSALLCVWPARA
jgi:hypothetical protein